MYTYKHLSSSVSIYVLETVLFIFMLSAALLWRGHVLRLASHALGSRTRRRQTTTLVLPLDAHRSVHARRRDAPRGERALRAYRPNRFSTFVTQETTEKTITRVIAATLAVFLRSTFMCSLGMRTKP